MGDYIDGAGPISSAGLTEQETPKQKPAMAFGRPDKPPKTARRGKARSLLGFWLVLGAGVLMVVIAVAWGNELWIAAVVAATYIALTLWRRPS